MNSSGHSLSQIYSWKHKNAFAKVGPTGDPIATLSTCLEIFPSKLKKLFCRAALKSFFKNNPVNVINFGIIAKQRITTYIYSMLIKRDSTSRLVMKSPGSWSAISLANSKLFFTVYILVVIGSRRGTRNLARLYVGVLIADIMGLKSGQLSTNCLWTLQRS